MRIVVGLGLGMLLACGASSPRHMTPMGPPGVDELFAEAGYRVVWPWTETGLDARGTRTDEHMIRAGTCLAIVTSDPSVEIEAGGATGLSAEGGAWLVGCTSTDGPIAVTLRGLPRGRFVLGMFAGPPEGNAQVRLAEHFQLRTPSSEQPPPALEIQENACDEDEAREHYRRGMELARTDKLAEAADALALAYACNADGTILFNLATVTAQRGRDNEAREMFAQLLRDHPNVPEELRAEVERALDRLLSPGTLRIRVAQTDQLFVNGVRVAFQGEEAVVEAIPGRHEVIVRTQDGERHEVRVHLRAEQELEMDPRAWVQSADERE